MAFRVPRYDHQPQIDRGTMARAANRPATPTGAARAGASLSSRRSAASVLYGIYSNNQSGAPTGPKLAWESAAHFPMTMDAIQPLFEINSSFVDLGWDVVQVDFTPANAWGKICKQDRKMCETGRNNAHFMKDAGQSNQQAFDASIEYIERNGSDAAVALKELVGLNSLLQAILPTDFVRMPIAAALHALQDSFSPAHVNRILGDQAGAAGQIVEIFEWNSTNKVGHTALDEQWKSGQSLSPLGAYATIASIEFVKCVVEAADTPNPRVAFKQFFADRLLAKVFVTAFPQTPGRKGPATADKAK